MICLPCARKRANPPCAKCQDDAVQTPYSKAMDSIRRSCHREQMVEIDAHIESELRAKKAEYMREWRAK